MEFSGEFYSVLSDLQNSIPSIFDEVVYDSSTNFYQLLRHGFSPILQTYQDHIESLVTNRIPDFADSWILSNTWSVLPNFVSEVYFDDRNLNLVVNSSFDIVCNDLPLFWSGTVALSEDSLIGQHSVSSSYFSQILYDVPAGTYYFGFSQKSAFTSTLTISSETSTTDIDLVGNSQWKTYGNSYVVTDNSDIRLTFTGEGLYDTIYFSKEINEWSPGYNDRYWVLPEQPKLGYFNEDQKLFYVNESSFIDMPPLDFTITSTDSRVWETQQEVLAMSSEVLFTLEPIYGTVKTWYEALIDEGATDLAILFYDQGSLVTFSGTDFYELDVTKVYTVNTTTTITSVIKGKTLAEEYGVLLCTGEHSLNYFDDRMDSDTLLEMYDASFSGVPTNITSPFGKLDLTITDTSILKFRRQPVENKSIINNKYSGYLISQLGTKLYYQWSYSGEYLTARPRTIADETLVNAKLALPTGWLDNKPQFEYLTDYTILDISFEPKRYLYILYTKDNLLHIGITHLNYIANDTAFIPLITSFKTDISYETVYFFGTYNYDSKLHIETLNNAYELTLLYPYITFSDNKLYSRLESTNIQVIQNDYNN